jgi:hypothetical protein
VGQVQTRGEGVATKVMKNHEPSEASGENNLHSSLHPSSFWPACIYMYFAVRCVKMSLYR